MREVYADELCVEHEPLNNAYQPRLVLGLGTPHDLEPGQAEPVLQHLRSIERHLLSRNYLETGFPCWSTLSHLARHFEGRIRIVHLTRHPVTTAFSWLTQGFYQPPLAPHLAYKELLNPFDAGVSFPEYQDVWESLSPYEKCLYFWAEVTQFGFSLREKLAPPWLQIRYEDIFDGDGLERLKEFLGLSRTAIASIDTSKKVDKFRFTSHSWADPGLVARHPQVLRLAESLGYDPTDKDPDQLFNRYMLGK